MQFQPRKSRVNNGLRSGASLWRGLPSAASVFAAAFLFFAVLIPSLHHSAGLPFRASAVKSVSGPKPAGSFDAGTTSAAHESQDQLLRHHADLLPECLICEWLFSAAYVASVTPTLLFLLLACSPRAPSLPIDSLCSRCTPRRASRAPPAAAVSFAA